MGRIEMSLKRRRKKYRERRVVESISHIFVVVDAMNDGRPKCLEHDWQVAIGLNNSSIKLIQIYIGKGGEQNNNGSYRTKGW